MASIIADALDAVVVGQLLALPMWSLRRPKAWEHLPGAADTLVATTGR